MYVDRYFMVRLTALLSFYYPVILVQLLCWWIILVLFNERKLKIKNDDMNEEFSNVLCLKLNIEGDFSIEITRWFYHYVLNKIKKNPVTILTSCQYLTGLINGILHFNNEHIFSCILICIYYLHTPIWKLPDLLEILPASPVVGDSYLQFSATSQYHLPGSPAVYSICYADRFPDIWEAQK